MSRYIYMQSPLPPLNSEYMRGLAKLLWDRKEYWSWARQPLEEMWQECDDAYLCYRELPMSSGMPWIDQSEFGPTDIFDGVNQLSTALALAIMPKNEEWLTMTALEGESPQLVKQLEAQQVWLHRKAKTRRVFSRHLKQLIVRGTSSVFWHWNQEIVNYRLTGLESIKVLAEQMGVSPEEARVIGRIREPRVAFNGPVVRTIDSLDLFLDPEADIVNDRRVASIVQTYRRLSDLLAEEDDAGEKLYDKKVLESITPYRAEDLYHKDTDGQRRLQSLNTMGVFPQNSVQASAMLVPVYIFYCPYLEYEGKEFYDTFFHVALSQEGDRANIIRIEENPSDVGHRFLITDNYIDWFTNVAYGISGIEKLLSGYRQLGVLESILLQAMVTSQFPAMLMQGGVLKEDQVLRTGPGEINEITYGALGPNFIMPIPTPDKGVQLGLQDTRWYKQKLADGFGNLGAFSDDPTKSMSTRETATSVNFRATTGSRTIDDQTEKFSDSLTELCQGIFDMSRQMARPDGYEVDPNTGEKTPTTSFNRINGNGTVSRESIRLEDFEKEREVQVLGLNGVTNRAQEVQEQREALEVVGTVGQFLPNAPLLAQTIALTLLSKLNVEVPKEAELSPQELAAMDPNVQMQALQLAMQNPQLIQQMLMGGQDEGPQGQGPQQAPPKQQGGGAGAGGSGGS